jgi:O-antigen/teichoic acid export membrane protein
VKNNKTYREQISNWIRQLPIYGKFGRDVSWNIASLGVLGISGILLNIIIARFYGAETLGVFNQVFALYIFFSQLAAFGIYFSVLKYVAEFSEDQSKCNAIITSAIVITTLYAGFISFIAFELTSWIGKILDSPLVARGWLFILPGIWGSALNKVLMAVLNGFRDMKAFALAQAMRYILAIVILVGCVMVKVPGYTLPVIISGAEIILLIFLFIYTLKFYSPVSIKNWAGWGRKHIHFGARSFLSGTIAELNTRVDVLMLGYFVKDRVVGVYSMASLIVEGFAMLSYVVRDNLNPILNKLIAQHKIVELKETIKRGVKIQYTAIALLGIVAIISYPFFIRLFISDSNFMTSWAPFSILMLGLMLCAGYLPFNMLLVMAGCPGLHTLLKGGIVLSNIILNLLLIPYFGMYGAAYATAISFLLSALYLKFLVRKTLNIRI